MRTAPFPLVIVLSALLALVQPVGSGAAARLQQAASPTPTASPEPTAVPPQARLLSPTGGQALQGSVAILGDLPLEGFVSAELAFAYSSDATATWFLITPIAAPVISGTLAAWDTTTITDGDYDLRLQAVYTDGRTLTATVEGLRVRNYSTIETSTPTPVTPTLTPLPGDTPIPTVTPTPTETPIPPTPTPLPPNPATLTQARIGEGLWRGALAIVGLFALMGIYQAARRLWLGRR